MEQVTVRTASLNDVETLLRFEQGVITAERPFDTTIKDGDTNYYDIVEMIKSPHIEIVVAEINNQVIGSGYARIEDSKPYLKHQKHGYLGFMYVEPAHRGKGINQKIIDTLKDWCAAQNITELRLQVYHDNLGAIKAYEKVGFVKLMLKMRMDI
jgi:RimJ/RimL family protein N-acetyltransferase